VVLTHFTPTDLLEKNATETERQQVLDITDYLINFNFKSIVLRESFKAEFLNENELLPEHQFQLWHDYQNKGLNPIDAKEVINELLSEHGFIIVGD